MKVLIKRIPYLLYLGILLLLTSCKTVDEQLHTHELLLKERWATTYQEQQTIKERYLSWDEAVEEMLRNNMDLANAEVDAYKASRSLKNVYKNFIPTLSLRGGYSRFLKNSTNLFRDRWTYGIDTFFNFSYIMELPVALYTGKLQVIRADIALMLKYREKVIELYKIYKEAEFELKRIEYKRWRKQYEFNKDQNFSPKSLFTNFNKENLETNSMGDIEDRLNTIISSPKYIWKLDTAYIPELNYRNRTLDFKTIEDVAQLQVKLLAIELEAARLRLWQINRKYWPDLNVSISTPNLFSADGSQSSFWSTEDIRYGANATWKIDTRGDIALEKEDFLRERYIQDRRMETDIIGWISKLTRVNESLLEIRKKKAIFEKQLLLVTQMGTAVNVEEFNERLQMMDQYFENKMLMEKTLVELETVLWFFDDTAWLK